MIYTTLNKIRQHQPCKDGWEKLLIHLNKKKADDAPLAMIEILESNGLEDTLWALRAVPEHNNLWRKYAVWCAQQVEHLMQDNRSKKALDVAWAHSEGEATDADLAAAAAAAETAAWAAWAAAETAWEAARAAAAVSAREAAETAARAAAWEAVGDAWAAAWGAARAAAEGAQKERLRTILEAGEWIIK